MPVEPASIITPKTRPGGGRVVLCIMKAKKRATVEASTRKFDISRCSSASSSGTDFTRRGAVSGVVGWTGISAVEEVTSVVVESVGADGRRRRRTVRSVAMGSFGWCWAR